MPPRAKRETRKERKARVLTAEQLGDVKDKEPVKTTGHLGEDILQALMDIAYWVNPDFHKEFYAEIYQNNIVSHCDLIADEENSEQEGIVVDEQEDIVVLAIEKKHRIFLVELFKCANIKNVKCEINQEDSEGIDSEGIDDAMFILTKNDIRHIQAIQKALHNKFGPVNINDWSIGLSNIWSNILFGLGNSKEVTTKQMQEARQIVRAAKQLASKHTEESFEEEKQKEKQPLSSSAAQAQAAVQATAIDDDTPDMSDDVTMLSFRPKSSWVQERINQQNANTGRAL